jgi:hypothetical protein
MMSSFSKMDVSRCLRLFYACYIAGIEAAYKADDCIRCEDFVHLRETTMTFGSLEEKDEIPMSQWKFLLLVLCRKLRLLNFAMERIMTKTNVLSTTISFIAMRFYTKGVKDWTEQPDESRLESFKTMGCQEWVRTRGKVKNMTKASMVSYIVQFCYECETVIGEKQSSVIRRNNFSIFRRLVWEMTRSKKDYKFGGDKISFYDIV